MQELGQDQAVGDYYIGESLRGGRHEAREYVEDSEVRTHLEVVELLLPPCPATIASSQIQQQAQPRQANKQERRAWNHCCLAVGIHAEVVDSWPPCPATAAACQIQEQTQGVETNKQERRIWNHYRSPGESFAPCS